MLGVLWSNEHSTAVIHCRGFHVVAFISRHFLEDMAMDVGSAEVHYAVALNPVMFK